ncbi:unnamed protein product [Lampetra fluviatilis]
MTDSTARRWQGGMGAASHIALEGGGEKTKKKKQAVNYEGPEECAEPRVARGSDDSRTSSGAWSGEAVSELRARHVSSTEG